MFERWAMAVASCLWIFGWASAAAAAPPVELRPYAGGPATVSALKTLLDAAPSAVVRGIQGDFGQKCDVYLATPPTPRFTRCTLNRPAWVDIYMDPSASHITDVQIAALAANGQQADARRVRSAKPACIRAFAYFFPGWPEAAQWLDRTYEAALASKAPVDVPTSSGWERPDWYGPVFHKPVGDLNVWVYKEDTQTGPDAIYIRIDITRENKPVQPGPFGDYPNGDEQ